MRASISALLVALSPAVASANTVEDVQGLGARANAMGGAGTATATDFAATYYAPANLGYCPTSELTLGLRHTTYELELEGDLDDPAPKELRNQTRIDVGFCNQLPYDFSLGLVFAMGLQNAMTLDQSTLNATPQFLLYGEALEQLSIMLGLGYRIIDEISIGIGVSILVNSQLGIQSGIPVVTDGSVEATVAWDLKPRASFVASIAARPIEQLHLAATYRSALFHDLDAPVEVEVEAAGVFLDVDLLIESAAWYSPQQISVGAAFDPVEILTLAVDLTWQDWSAHPGPFLIVTPVGDGVSAGLEYAPREDYGFRDVLIPKVGAELRLMEHGEIALRAGYQFRPAMAPVPAQTSNLLDSDIHAVSLGGGYRFGARPDDPSLVATGPHIVGATGSIDVFFRLAHMKSRQVARVEPGPLDAYSFGGNVIDLGIQFSIGWF